MDRAHAGSELKCHHNDMIKAGQACMVHAKTAEERIFVLGVDEPDFTSNMASPDLSDGWLVADFYLWLHILDGMGRSQEWTS